MFCNYYRLTTDVNGETYIIIATIVFHLCSDNIYSVSAYIYITDASISCLL